MLKPQIMRVEIRYMLMYVLHNPRFEYFFIYININNQERHEEHFQLYFVTFSISKKNNLEHQLSYAVH